jgi:hypothetical protein
MVHRKFFFLYLFYHEFAKIYGSVTNFAKIYTSAAVAHGVRRGPRWQESPVVGP